MHGAVKDFDANLSFFQLLATACKAFFYDKTKKAGHPLGT